MSHESRSRYRLQWLYGFTGMVWQPHLARTRTSVLTQPLPHRSKLNAQCSACAHTWILVDVSFDNILELISNLRSDSPQTRILAFAVQEDIRAILSYAGAGADGFVTATAP